MSGHATVVFCSSTDYGVIITVVCQPRRNQSVTRRGGRRVERCSRVKLRYAGAPGPRCQAARNLEQRDRLRRICAPRCRPDIRRAHCALVPIATPICCISAASFFVSRRLPLSVAFLVAALSGALKFLESGEAVPVPLCPAQVSPGWSPSSVAASAGGVPTEEPVSFEAELSRIFSLCREILPRLHSQMNLPTAAELQSSCGLLVAFPKRYPITSKFYRLITIEPRRSGPPTYRKQSRK